MTVFVMLLISTIFALGFVAWSAPLPAPMDGNYNYNYDSSSTRRARTPRLRRSRNVAADLGAQTSRPHRPSSSQVSRQSLQHIDDASSFPPEIPRPHRSRNTQGYLDNYTERSTGAASDAGPSQSAHRQNNIDDEGAQYMGQGMSGYYGTQDGSSPLPYLHPLDNSYESGMQSMSYSSYPQTPAPDHSSYYGATSSQSYSDLPDYSSGLSSSYYPEAQEGTFVPYGGANVHEAMNAMSLNWPSQSSMPATVEQDYLRGSDYNLSSQSFPQSSGDYYEALPTKQEYVAPWEYQLRVTPDFFWRSEDDLVYSALSDDQKLVMVEHIHSTRPFHERYIRTELAGALTASLAFDLLSYDTTRIDHAVEVLHPKNVRKRGVVATWMDGLIKSQRLEVIDKIATATLQDPGELRDHFLDINVESNVVLQILLASTDEEYIQIARGNNLYLAETCTTSPWQKGLSTIQKRALRQRMMTMGAMTERKFYQLVNKEKVPAGYGLKMLRAFDEKFRSMIMWLATRGEGLMIRPD
ncbi:hypothetical protein CBS101457_000212 [Exobasidium rhododendri]|nr:hypothetical protein CBS101457_000212 [Exobasidium rhododendri]